MTLSRFITLTYIYSLFREFRPIYPLYAIMFAEVGLLSGTEITILMIIWMIASMSSEIPTGIVADKISRRYSALIGQILIVGTFTTWLLFPSFWGYATGFLLWGLGYAFASGATEAYLYDMIKKLGGEADFSRYFARSNSIKVFGMFLAYILATALIPYGYETVLIVSIAVSSIAPLLLLCMPKDHVIPDTTVSYLSLFRNSLTTIKKSPTTWVLASIIVYIAGFIGVTEEYIGLFYTWNGFSAQQAALFLTIGLLGSSTVSWFANTLDRFSLHTLVVVISLASGLLFASGYMYGLLAVVAIYIYIETMVLVQTNLDARLQKNLESKTRATAGSVVSFTSQLFGLATLCVLYGIQNVTSDVQALTSLGVVIVGISLYYFIQSKKLSLQR